MSRGFGVVTTLRIPASRTMSSNAMRRPAGSVASVGGTSGETSRTRSDTIVSRSEIEGICAADGVNARAGSFANRLRFVQVASGEARWSVARNDVFEVVEHLVGQSSQALLSPFGA